MMHIEQQQHEFDYVGLKAEVCRIREEILSEICRIIEIEAIRGNNRPPPIKSLHKLSSAFESHLFKSATSIPEYQDVTTLRKRIKNLARRIAKPSTHYKKRRNDIDPTVLLRSRLGNQKFEDVTNIVTQIMNIRHESYSILLGPAIDSNEERHSYLSVPEEIKNIHFRTKLVDNVVEIYKACPTKSMAFFIDRLNWEDLIVDAIQTIQAYDQWKKTGINDLMISQRNE